MFVFVVMCWLSCGVFAFLRYVISGCGMSVLSLWYGSFCCGMLALLLYVSFFAVWSLVCGILVFFRGVLVFVAVCSLCCGQFVCLLYVIRCCGMFACLWYGSVCGRFDFVAAC